MEIRSRRRGGEDGGRVVTIALDAADDPQDHLNGLVAKGRLEALLGALGRPGRLTPYQEAEDLREALQRLSYMEKRTEAAVDYLMVAAKDAGLSYGQIATAMELHRQTVVSRIERVRKAMTTTNTPSDSQEEA